MAIFSLECAIKMSNQWVYWSASQAENIKSEAFLINFLALGEQMRTSRIELFISARQNIISISPNK